MRPLVGQAHFGAGWVLTSERELLAGLLVAVVVRLTGLAAVPLRRMTWPG